MIGPRTRRCWLLLTALLLAVLSAALLDHWAHAQAPAASSEQPLRFRRAYVPEDQLSEMVRGYVPMRRDEFADKLKTISSETGAAAVTQGAHIAFAEYSARLEKDLLVDGQAKLEVIHDARQSTTLLPLDGLQLAIGQPVWKYADAGERVDAQVGLGAAGQLVAAVSQSGQLEFPWSLRGHSDGLGQLQFEFGVPSSPATRLRLLLPAGVVPICPAAVVHRSDPAESAAASASSGTADETLQPWWLDLGGGGPATVTLTRSEEAGQHSQLVLARQMMVYELLPRGVEAQMELQLDVFHEPLSELVLELDPGLQLTAARSGQEEISWRQHSGPDGSALVTLQFLQPLQGTGRTLRLAALAPLVAGERWRLPAIRPRHVVWQEGSATVEVAPSLMLEELHTSRGRHLKSSVAADGSEVIQLQYFAPTAAVDLRVSYRKPQVQLLAGTTVTVETVMMQAVHRARLTTSWGELYELQAVIPRAWYVQSVEATPTSAMKDYSVSVEEGRQLLTVRLEEALRSDEELLLQIRARRRLPAAQSSLEVRHLRFITYQQVVQARHLICVRAKPPLQMQMHSDLELERLAVEDLNAQQSSLIEASGGGLIFWDDPAADGVSIEVSSEKPSYAAEVNLTATVAGEMLSEHYSIRCAPEAAHVRRLLVQIAPGRHEPLQWTLDDGQLSQPLTARLQRGGTRSEQADGSGGQLPLSSDELWEIELDRAHSEPFTIIGTRVSPFTSRTQLALAALPEAASQVGVVVINAKDGQSLAIAEQGVKPIPAGVHDTSPQSMVRGVYRYQPLQDARIWIARAAAQDRQPAAWVWSSELHSQITHSGHASHWLVLRVENAGRERLELRLPEHARADQVLVGGAPSLLVARGQTLMISLPEQVRFPLVQVAYRTAEQPLQVIDTLEIPLPLVDVPVLAQQSTLWLPPDFAFRHAQTSRSALTWQQRMFGPLARADGHPFRLFSARDWTNLVHTDRRDARSAQGDEFLRQLQEARRSVAQPATWRELLSQYQKQQARSSLPPLLLDHVSLGAQGIRPSALLRVEDPVDDQNLSLLKQSSLALLVHDEALLLTTITQRRLIAEQLGPTQHDQIALIDEGPMAERIEQQMETPSLFVPVEVWLTSSYPNDALWTSQASWPGAEMAASGWIAYRHSGSPTSDQQQVLRVAVFQPRVLQGCGWATFLIVGGIVAWAAAGALQRIAIWATLLALAALWLPPLYAPLATGAFLGTLLAGAMALVPRKELLVRRVADSPSTASRAPAAAPASLLLTGLVWVAWSLVAHAQQPLEVDPPPDPPPLSTTYRVLIPVDEQQQPSGQYLHLPRPFYEELHRRAASIKAAPQGWLILAGEYEASLIWSTVGTKLDITRVAASYDVEVFQPRTRLSLPLRRDAVQVLQAQIDDQSVPFSWDMQDRQLIIELDQPGRYKLDLVLRPIIQTQDNQVGFAIDIPRVPQAQLRLDSPADAPAVLFPTALGEATLDGAAGQWLVELGPASQLTIQWPADPGTGAAAADVEVAQLAWLKVLPNTVTLDTKFHFVIRSGRLDEIQLLVDPRLRMLPLRGDQPVESGFQLTDGQKKTIRLPLKQDAGDEFTLQATFHVSGTSGIGNISLPQVAAVADRVQQNWLGVSVAPTLEFDAADGLGPLDPGTFASAWGSVEVEPDLAYRIPAEQVVWTLATSPRQSQPLVDQRLDVSVGRSAAELMLRAQLTAESGGLLQCRLAIPPEATVHEVTMPDSGVERVRRWVRNEQGVLTVFFNDGISGTHQLAVHASVPLNGSARRNNAGALQAAPRIYFEDSIVTGDRLFLYRRPEVTIDVDVPEALIPVEEETRGQYREGLGRLVGAWRIPESPASGSTREPLRLSVRPNQVRANALQTTRLIRDQDTWYAEVTFALQVEQGLVDALRWDIPTEWTGPFELDRTAPYEVLRASMESHRQLVLRPSEAIAGHYQVRMRGMLTATPARVPDIMPLDVQGVQRFVVVPTRVDLRQIAWETIGLKLDSLPEDHLLEPLDDLATYRVVGPRFQAMIKEVTRVSGEAQVALMDVYVARQPDSSVQGVTAFDVEPAGRTECVLVCPPGYEPIQMWVGGLPAVVQRVDAQRWQIRLASDHLPQRLEVAFRGRVATGSAGGILRTPVLDQIRVQRTLWTVYHADEPSPGRVLPLEANVQPMRQELVRLSATAKLIDVGATVVTEAAAREVHDWYLKWSGRLAGVQQRIAYLQLLAGRMDALDRREVERIEQQQLEIAQRIQVAESTDSSSGLLMVTAIEPWRASRSSPAEATHCIFTERVPSVVVQQRSAATSDVLTRLLLALLLLGGLGAVVMGTQSSLLRDLLMRWPQTWGVLLGLAWWLWLTPSLLGWLIILACVISAVRPTHR